MNDNKKHKADVSHSKTKKDKKKIEMVKTKLQEENTTDESDNNS